MAVRIGFLVLLLSPAWGYTQTPAQIDDLLSRYQSERKEAARIEPFSPALKHADELVARAEEERKNNLPRAAARLIHDARWILPALPSGLPEHVARVIGYSRLRHADRVNAIAYSPDGKQLASVSRDRTLRVWNLENGREIYSYHDFPTGEINEKNPENDNVLKVADVVYAPDGKYLAVAGANEIHLLDTTTGKKIRVLTGSVKSLKALAISPDSKWIVSGGNDNIVRIWDSATGNILHSFAAQPARIEGLSYSPDGKRIAAVDDDGNLFFYDAASREPAALFNGKAMEGPTVSIRGVAFLPNSTSVLTAGNDKSPPRIITIPAPGSKGFVTTQKFPGHTDVVSAVATVPGNKLVITASEDRTVRVWDIESGKTIRQFQGHLGKMSALAVRPDGNELATASDDGSIRIWTLSATDEHETFEESADSIWATTFSPDGSQFAVTGADRVIRVYSSVSKKLKKALKGHKGSVTSVVFLGEDRLASAGGDKVIKIWNLNTGQAERDLVGHTAAILALATAQGKIYSGGADRTVKVWDAADAKPIRSWQGQSTVTTIAVRPNSPLIAVGSADGALTLLDTAGSEWKVTGSLLAHHFGVSSVAFHPQGALLASAGGDGQAKLWTLTPTNTLAGTPRIFETGMKAQNAGATTALSTIAFSPDGRMLAAAGVDTLIHIWNTSTSVEVRTIRGNTEWVTALQFSPNSGSLLSGSVDKKARLFSLAESIGVALIGHAMVARAVAITRDGQTIATAADDKTVKIWNRKTGEEKATLTGPVDSTYSLAFLGTNQVVAGGQDGRVRWLQIEPMVMKNSANTGNVYVIIAGPEGKKLGVWSKNNSAQDVFEIYSSDGKSETSYAINSKDRQVSCGTFRSDLRITASGDGEGRIRLWDFEKKDKVGTDWPLFEKTGVADLGLSRDGKHVLAISTGGELKIAEIESRKEVASVNTGVKAINGLILAPTDARIAVLGSDGDVRVLDFRGKELRRWMLPSAANAAVFTPDATQLITANADGIAYVLTVP